MTWVVDLFVVAILAYAAYAGYKRGAVLMGLELTSFLIATAVALLTYHAIGVQVRLLANTSTAVANVAGFTLAWVVTELACAFAARIWVMPHLTHDVQISRPNHLGGSLLGIMKSLVMVALAVIVLAGMPFSTTTRHAITDSYFGNFALSSSGSFQSWLAQGLGHDLGESLNFFTVTSDPESTQNLELGFHTTGTADPAEEESMLGLINHERTTRGLKPLTMNEDARKVARDHSLDMFKQGYFSHVSPDGKSPFDRMRKGGVEFGTAGENLALAPTLTLAHHGLMNSPGHRANILSDRYRTVGIGIIDGGPYGLMVTQDFTD
jgi:uncharacterized protein YkwD